ncbi:MAG TPA: hypothetical protein VJR92_09285 [Gemmatimonadaceae bacterium]|nr:hypothetical protein [Gemmatimonadaceae bacterium]
MRPVFLLGWAAFFIAATTAEIDSIWGRTTQTALLGLALNALLILGVVRLRHRVSIRTASLFLLATLGLFVAVVSQSSEWADAHWARRATYLTHVDADKRGQLR